MKRVFGAFIIAVFIMALLAFGKAPSWAILAFGLNAGMVMYGILLQIPD